MSSILFWIKNELYKIKLIAADELDYYTNIIIVLDIQKKEYKLYDDNLLYLKNITEQYFKCIKQFELDPRINCKDLGLLQNEYYYCIFEDNIINDDTIVQDDNGEWIGTKYCCFETKEYSTWLYKIKDTIQLKVTPNYYGFLKSIPSLEYNEFVKTYKDIITIDISVEELQNLTIIINNLFEKMI